MSWEEITPDMKGETVCARGLIARLTQSPQVGCRYSFSETPNTFFLFSNFWEISNSDPGKTVGVGTCVEVTGEIEIQGGVPFIHIDDLISGASTSIGGFLIYDDPAACG
jgi:hypothetical protein